MGTRDYTSIYSIKDFFLEEIAPKYFDVDNLALLNAGLFGMITDIAGTVAEDSMNVTERYLNETMPARANLPDFIYSNAALYGVSDILARPAQMPFLLFIKESDVLENAKNVNNHKEFTIDSSMTITVDNLNYSIPYNIIIRSTKYKGEYSHLAYYDRSLINDAVSVKTPYIKVLRMETEGDMWLVLRVDVYQYIRRRYEEPIITNSKLNIPYVELSYTNQLCNFEVLYQSPNSTKTIQLQKLMETTPPITSPSIFYKFLDDQTIRLSFSNDDRYFTPDYNSNLIIYLYETVGVKGNFDYYDTNPNVTLNTEKEEYAYNRITTVFGQLRGDSSGGRDQLTTESIKRLAMENMVTIKSYTTDEDLNLHFLNFASLYNSDAVFIKHRDDYAGREYGCFTRLGNGTDIYPTNTLDIRLKISDVDKHFESLKQYIINPGTRFGYEGDSLSTVVKIKSDYPEQEIEYASMALMIITLRPNKVKYYLNSIDKNVDLEYTYLNTNSLFNFLSTSCHVERNAILGEMSYKINVGITRVDGVTKETDYIGDESTSNMAEIDPERLTMLMLFNTSSGHYVKMTYDGYDEETMLYKFSTVLETTDMIDDERIFISNLIDRYSNEEDGRIIKMVNPDIKFAVFYRYESENEGHEYIDIDCVKDSTICNIYTPYEDEFYFAYPLNLMRSHVIFEDDPTCEEGFSFLIKQSPMFGKDFIMKKENINPSLEKIVKQHDFLTKTLNEITANFTINIKFYNTYGRSRLFYVNVNRKDELLNHVNTYCKFMMEFKEGVIVEDYLPRIRQFIKTYIEKINLLSDGTNDIKISVLIQKLHNEFEQIDHIILDTINGYPPDVQTIEMKEKLDSTTSPTVVPEYLTLEEKNVVITTI